MRWLTRLCLWFLRKTVTQSIACAIEPNRPDVVVLVLKHSADVPLLIHGAMHVYCNMNHVARPEIEGVDVDDNELSISTVH